MLFPRKRLSISVLRKAAGKYSDDRILTVAGGVTFFALLALFPAISGLVSIYGYFGDRAALSGVLASFNTILPGGGMEILGAELKRVSALPPSHDAVAFAISLVIALWSASGGLKSLIDGLNQAFEVRETRRFIPLAIGALAGTAVILVAIGGLIRGSGFLMEIAARQTSSPLLRQGLAVLFWPALFVGIAAAIALLFRFGPNRSLRPQSFFTWGSVTAAICWILLSLGFTWYVENYGSYNRTYGALGSAVGFLTWIWLSLAAMYFGAEIDAELDAGRVRADPHRAADKALVPAGAAPAIEAPQTRGKRHWLLELAITAAMLAIVLAFVRIEGSGESIDAGRARRRRAR